MLERFWYATSELLSPFFGEVRILDGYIRRGSRLYTDAKTEPDPTRSWWWRGIPPELGCGVVIGGPYFELWPRLREKATTRSGLAFLSLDDWRAQRNVAELVGGVPTKLALEFMPYWGKSEFGGLQIIYPDTYPEEFPFGSEPS